MIVRPFPRHGVEAVQPEYGPNILIPSERFTCLKSNLVGIIGWRTLLYGHLPSVSCHSLLRHYCR